MAWNRGLLPVATALLFTACDCSGDGSDGGPFGGTGGVGGWAIECDEDGDGHLAPPCGGDDCEDGDASIHPGAAERCDGLVDDDCDGLIDQGCACASGDFRSCYPPGLAASSRWVGSCADGLQRCGDDGSWRAECEGAITPAEEGTACDGIDQDCDGVADGALLDRCGGCGPGPEEVCGNGLDDDCDGEIDDAASCRVHCGGVDPEAPPPGLGCCVADPATFALVPVPVRHSRTCVEWEGLPGCETDERRCLDLDGEDATLCVKVCLSSGAGGTRCLCGRDAGGAEPAPDPGCGFETPCAFEDCADRTGQPCYSGPPATLGVGICRGGRHDCMAGEGGLRAWGTCEGEVLPGVERCGNGLDDDCDGLIDEQDGATGRRCVTGAHCGPEAAEICGNGLDDDCDGRVDEGCPARESRQPCFRGPAGARWIGACRDGTQEQEAHGWGPCTGDVLPGPESCGDGVDSDCNGLGGPGAAEDQGCPGPSSEEACNGRDDDRDGLADEGLADACGACAGSCYRTRFERPSDCLDRRGERCSNVEASGGDPETLTLARDKRVADLEHVLYFQTKESRWQREWAKLVQVDAETGAVRWVAPTGGKMLGPVALGLDGSVWAGHIAPYSWNEEVALVPEEETPLVHFDAQGNLLCKLVLPGRVGGIVADDRGFVWVANGLVFVEGQDLVNPERHHLYKVHGSRVRRLQPDGRPWPDGTPRCEVVDLVPGSPEEALDIGYPLHRLTIDSRGILWGIGLNPRSNLFRFDTTSLGFQWIATTGGPICVGPDDAVWTLRPYPYTGSFARILSDGPYEPAIDPVPAEFGYSHEELVVITTSTRRFLNPGPLLCASSGRIWALRPDEVDWDNPLWFDPANQAQGDLAIPYDGAYPTPPYAFTNYDGFAEDRNGFIWLPAWSGSGYPLQPDQRPRLLRLDPSTDHWETFPLPTNLFLIAGDNQDLAGAAVIQRAASAGRYEIVFDAGWATVDWRRFDWAESVPAGASVQATLRFAATGAGLDATTTVCSFVEPPADLETCAGADGKRFVSVELTLRPGPGGERPVVRDLQLEWTRP